MAGLAVLAVSRTWNSKLTDLLIMWVGWLFVAVLAKRFAATAAVMFLLGGVALWYLQGTGEIDNPISVAILSVVIYVVGAVRLFAMARQYNKASSLPKS